MGFILQSILGGAADHFAVVEVENWVSKFTVLSKDVGLPVYKMGSFRCADFKVIFNL